MRIFLRKICSLILVSFQLFYIFQVWKNSLWKINIAFILKEFWKEERFSLSEAVARISSMRKIAHKFLLKFTCNIFIKETQTQVYFYEFIKFLKTTLSQNTCKWLVLDFEQFSVLYVSLHKWFHLSEQRECMYFLNVFLNVFNRISTSKNYCQKI